MSLKENQYNSFNDIPYLNNISNYKSDLSYSLNDISYQSLYNGLNNANSENATFLEERESPIFYNGDLNEDPLTDLDSAMVNTIKNNKNMIIQKSKNELEYLKSVSNRLKNVQNNKYNNQLIKDIFYENQDSPDLNLKTNGELEITEDQIKILKNNNEIKTKQVKIAEYYNKKRQYQIKVFQNACSILFIMFVIGLLFKMRIIHENLFAGFMGLGFAILVIYFGYVSIDMIFRDNENFDEYTFIHSSYYLNKNEDGDYDDIPSYMQKDLVSAECLDMSLNKRVNV